MSFFKSKHNYGEILPPPPPPPDMELEDEMPVFSDKIIKPEKIETFPEEKGFSDLVKDLDKGSKPKKAISKKEKITIKKAIAPKKQKIQIKPMQAKKTVPIRQIKKKKPQLKRTIQEKRLSIRRAKIKKTEKKVLHKISEETKKPKDGLHELGEDFGNISFELPKELKAQKEVELPETLEELDTGDLEKFEQEIKFKPKEVLEAEEEIKSAIDRIKVQEKPSIFRRLFAKKEIETPAEQLTPELTSIDEVSMIQNGINKARQALMKFDLEAAKKNYIEIMKVYNSIKPEEQAKVHQDIKDLYFERKSAEELKV